MTGRLLRALTGWSRPLVVTTTRVRPPAATTTAGVDTRPPVSAPAAAAERDRLERELAALRAAALEVAVHLHGTSPVHDMPPRRCRRWCRACALDRLLDELGVTDPYQVWPALAAPELERAS